MSAERSGKSHAVAWTLSILAVPMYLLSVAPLVHVFGHYNGLGLLEIPNWFEIYAKPHGWVIDGSPALIQRLNDDYKRWWLKACNPAVARDYGL